MCNYFSSELNSSKIITDNKNLLEDDFRAEYFFFCKFLTIFSETIKMTPKLGLTINVTKYVPVLSKILEISNIPMLVVKISLAIKDILLYSAFDPGIKSTSTDVYFHEIPGGQFSNLFVQAKNVCVCLSSLPLKAKTKCKIIA